MKKDFILDNKLDFSNYKEAFSELWEAVSGRGSWERDKGEYVVAYDFVKIPKEKLSL